MGMLELHPDLQALAMKRGQEAARAIRLGRVPEPCPWSGDSPSLTQRRMAGVFARAYAAATPEPNPLPE